MRNWIPFFSVTQPLLKLIIFTVKLLALEQTQIFQWIEESRLRNIFHRLDYYLKFSGRIGIHFTKAKFHTLNCMRITNFVLLQMHTCIQYMYSLPKRHFHNFLLKKIILFRVVNVYSFLKIHCAHINLLRVFKKKKRFFCSFICLMHLLCIWTLTLCAIFSYLCGGFLWHAASVLYRFIEKTNFDSERHKTITSVEINGNHLNAVFDLRFFKWDSEGIRSGMEKEGKRSQYRFGCFASWFQHSHQIKYVLHLKRNEKKRLNLFVLSAFGILFWFLCLI